jgi:hypothetical protein
VKTTTLIQAQGLPSFSSFLIRHLLRHPTVVTVPVAPVELVDDVGIGVVTVDGIRTDLLFFAGV